MNNKLYDEVINLPTCELIDLFNQANEYYNCEDVIVETEQLNDYFYDCSAIEILAACQYVTLNSDYVKCSIYGWEDFNDFEDYEINLIVEFIKETRKEGDYID